MIRPFILGTLLLIVAGSAVAQTTTVMQSSPSACRWLYQPGTPTVEHSDSTNPNGIFLQWEETNLRICGDFLQPVKVFLVVVPHGTTPVLTTDQVQAASRGLGLPGRPGHVSAQGDAPSSEWARMTNIEDWRGFRLARIEVYPQRGDRERSEVLQQIVLNVAFSGKLAEVQPTGRDAATLQAIAVNGAIANTWWRDPVRALRSTMDESASVWPGIDLARVAVTETGLYAISGAWSGASSLLGQPSSKIKMYGNGGRMLPYYPDVLTDSLLREDAIFVKDGGDGRFDRGDTVFFFGRGVKGPDYCDGTDLNGLSHQSPFTTENIYFIGADPTGPDGLRMAQIPTSGNGVAVDSSDAREYVEQDAFIYAGSDQPLSGQIWYMTTMGPQESRAYSINLDGALGSSARLTLNARSRDYFYGTFNIYVGTTRVYSGTLSNIPVITVAAGILTPGINSVRLENVSSTTVYVNFIDIKYQRRLSTTTGAFEFSAPAQRTGLFQYTIADIGSGGYLLDISEATQPRMARGTVIVDSSTAGSARRYYAVRPDRIRTPLYRGVKVRPQAQNGLDYVTLRDTTNEAEMIILTYDDGYAILDSLKRFHQTYREEPLPHTMRVRLTDVWDEFGWGVHDAVAIRNFLKYAYTQWRGHSLKYVLMVGDGNYDYRGIEPDASDNLMPVWERNDTCEDDFFSRFTNSASLPTLRMGRWPVQNNEELQIAVSKTISYANTPLYGPWKNTATFAADDEWKNGQCREHDHTEQAETLINSVLPDYFTFKKIYELFYPFRSGPTGATKPDATRDLIESINQGTLLINFAGHGNERVWTDEQMFVMERDRGLLQNHRMQPFFFAATCSWGAYDRALGRCYPELLLAQPDAGGIASVAATRFTYIGGNDALTREFYRALFQQGIGVRQSFGEALFISKSRVAGSTLYHVLGDPVLRLATPEYYGRVTSSSDSLQALSLFTLSGEVSQTPEGPVWQDFNGVVEARVFDTENFGVYYWCGRTSGDSIRYSLPGNAIFRGTASVNQGRFNVTFRVPRDVRYGGNNAKISLYFYGKGSSDADSADGVGIKEHLLIASQASSERDSIPPQIKAWLEIPSFRPGDLVSSSPKLHVDIADSSGINLSGEVGHKITVRIDDAQTEDLTPFFNYDLDRHTVGSLDKTIGPLAEGEHRLIVEAWDSFNNLNQSTLTFTVGKSGEAGYAIRDVYNWPNPMKDITRFTYFLTQDGTRNVSVKVFTLSGKLVYEAAGLGTRGPAFNSNADRPWDGRDREGHDLANGVYFYRIKAEHSNGHSAEATGKLVIMR
jgi:hypothetical protein